MPARTRRRRPAPSACRGTRSWWASPAGPTAPPRVANRPPTPRSGGPPPGAPAGRPPGGAARRTRAGRGAGPPAAAQLRGQTVVVLDGIAPTEVGAGFERALATLVHEGGGLLLLGGPPPGLARYRAGSLGAELALEITDAATIGSSPEPTPEARELLAWDDDAARGDRAWRAAAPLAEVLP